MPLRERDDLDPLDPLPAAFINAEQEFLGAAQINFVVRIKPGAGAVLQVPASPGNGRAAVAIDGRWRWVEVNVERAALGGVARTLDVYVTAAESVYTAGTPGEVDSTDRSFALALVEHNAAAPAGVDLTRKVAEVVWDGAQFTTVNSLIGGVVDTTTRPPSGPAGGALGGMYPNPTLGMDVALLMGDALQEGVVGSGDGLVTRLSGTQVRVAAGSAWIDGDGVNGLMGRYRVTWPQTDITLSGSPPGPGNEIGYRITVSTTAEGHGVSAPDIRVGSIQPDVTHAVMGGVPAVGGGELQLATVIATGSTGLGATNDDTQGLRDRRRFARGALGVAHAAGTDQHVTGARTSMAGMALPLEFSGAPVEVNWRAWMRVGNSSGTFTLYVSPSYDGSWTFPGYAADELQWQEVPRDWADPGSRFWASGSFIFTPPAGRHIIDLQAQDGGGNWWAYNRQLSVKELVRQAPVTQ